jgi:hypothetical protein
MRSCYYCKEADKPAIDLEACAKAARLSYWRLSDDEDEWDWITDEAKTQWTDVAASVLKAAGVK